ncbi:hypothetical protein BDK51DRAFT_42681 [Blyttiomyces helicus]|uniref:PA domain-containing protein n=1 Tax=Blyttiomyces helicus TaxID=388810 RepID=A0A4V1IR28_9FUNG|nr:hypothetical protein BDK51DRAFT_42681 [Blyttiomyces helicus]|eukprot:RKO88607.1 hypothetical protein BDK51DRAFT_42681 [Blyttiomyces helicus]
MQPHRTQHPRHRARRLNLLCRLSSLPASLICLLAALAASPCLANAAESQPATPSRLPPSTTIPQLQLLPSLQTDLSTAPSFYLNLSFVQVTFPQPANNTLLVPADTPPYNNDGSLPAKLHAQCAPTVAAQNLVGILVNATDPTSLLPPNAIPQNADLVLLLRTPAGVSLDPQLALLAEFGARVKGIICALDSDNDDGPPPPVSSPIPFPALLITSDVADHLLSVLENAPFSYFEWAWTGRRPFPAIEVAALDSAPSPPKNVDLTPWLPIPVAAVFVIVFLTTGTFTVCCLKRRQAGKSGSDPRTLKISDLDVPWATSPEQSVVAAAAVTTHDPPQPTVHRVSQSLPTPTPPQLSVSASPVALAATLSLRSAQQKWPSSRYRSSSLSSTSRPNSPAVAVSPYAATNIAAAPPLPFPPPAWRSGSDRGRRVPDQVGDAGREDPPPPLPLDMTGMDNMDHVNIW